MVPHPGVLTEHVLLGGLLLIGSGCSTPPLAPAPVAAPAPGGPAKQAYLVSHGWHVGIAVERADVSTEIWPESADLGPRRYVEVGWGDGDYYKAERGTIALALKAAFRSEAAVLHVAALDTPIAEFFEGSKVLEIPLSSRGFEALTRFFHASYARDAGGRPIVVAPGIYAESRFYRATGQYRLLDNSNNWAARALAAAGCPIDPAESISAGSVMHRAVAFGRVIRPGSVWTQATLDEAETERCR